MKTIKQTFLFFLLINILAISKLLAQEPVPIINTKPGAPYVIFLDFRAATPPTVSERQRLFPIKSQDASGKITSFRGSYNIRQIPSNATTVEIRRRTRLIEEFFSIFNINVTTDKQVYDNTVKENRQVLRFLNKQEYFTSPVLSNGDKLIDTPLLITEEGSGGIFSGDGTSIVWENLNRDDEISTDSSIALVAVHEAGHALGLDHHNSTVARYNTAINYFVGYDNYNVIMGSGKGQMEMWSNGDYLTAKNTTQDDIKTILSHPAITLVNDKHGNAISSATKLANNNGNFYFSGVISTRQDKDFASFTSTGGGTKIILELPKDHMLHPKLTIYNNAGNIVEILNPDSRTQSSFDYTLNLTPGTYHIEVDGVGRTTETVINGTQASFSDYGSLGQFEIYIDNSKTNSTPINTKIEAENFFISQGVKTETTTDTGGGKNVGNINTGDFMYYKVNLPDNGKYDVTFRVASLTQEINLEATLGNTAFFNAKRSKTNGWQSFEDLIVKNVAAVPGDQILKIKANSSFWNINWIEIKPATPTGFTAIPGKIEAESHSGLGGAIVENTPNTTNGKNIGSITTSLQAIYNIFVPEPGLYDFIFKVASQSKEINLGIRQGRSVFADGKRATTGAWHNYQDLVIKNVNLPMPGAQAIDIVANGDGWNFDSFEVVPAGTTTTPTPPSETACGSGVTISGLTATAASDTSVNVSFNNLSNVGVYEVRTFTAGTFSGSISGSVKYNSGTTSPITVTGLTAGTNYTFAIRAICSGTGAGSSKLASVDGTTSGGGNNNGGNNNGGSNAGQATFGNNGAPWAVPGTIESENYDTGGQGVAYSDTNAANNGNQYRTNEGVDIAAAAGGGFQVGWTATGEWLEYTVNIASAGTYNAAIVYAAGGASPGAINIEFNGTNATGGNVSLVPTGGWNTFQTIDKAVTLAAGQQVMRVNSVTPGFNLNRITFTQSGGGNNNGGNTGGDTSTPPPPVSVIPFGKKIGIQPVIANGISSTQKFDYISVRFNEGSIPKSSKILNATALRAIGEWESFVIEDGGNGTVRVKVKNFGSGYKYLVVTGTAVTATGTSATAAASQFTWETVGAASAKQFGLKSVSTGKYLQIPQNQNGSISLNVNGGARGAWELFTYFDTNVAAKKLNTSLGITINTNPVTNGIIELSNANNASYTISSISGQKVSSGSVINNTIDASDLSSGLFIIQFVIDGNTQIEKVVIQ